MAKRGRPAVAVATWSVCLLSLAGMFSQAFVNQHGVDWTGIGWALAWAGFPVAGAVIVSRRPQNHVGRAMMGAGIALAIGDTSDALVPRDYLTAIHHSVLTQIAINANNWIFAPAYLLIVMVPLLFPQGRFVGRWRAVAWVLTIDTALLVVGAATRARVHLPRNGRSVPNPLHVSGLDGLGAVVPALTATLVLGGVAVIVWSVIRYWRSRGIERLQRKWIAFTVLTGGALFVAAAIVDPATGLGNLLSLAALTVGISGTGAAIATAVLRYHLYDIDRLISRTLSYAVLTGMLVAVYVGLVTFVTKATTVNTSWGVATATLVVAALFNPLRVRVQRSVDHRFNRARYDAARVVDAFAAHVRDAVAFEAVREELASTVQKTVQPTHVSVWIA